MSWAIDWAGGVMTWVLGDRAFEPVMGGLRAFLLDDTDIASLVLTRIYPLRLPQKVTLPAIVLTRVSDLRDAHLRGVQAQAKARYQVDYWAQTYDGAALGGALCARRLGGFQGTWTLTTSPPQTVSVTILPEPEMDLFEEDINGGVCRHSADYGLWHRAA